MYFVPYAYNLRPIYNAKTNLHIYLTSFISFADLFIFPRALLIQSHVCHLKFGLTLHNWSLFC